MVQIINLRQIHREMHISISKEQKQIQEEKEKIDKFSVSLESLNYKKMTLINNINICKKYKLQQLEKLAQPRFFNNRDLIKNKAEIIRTRISSVVVLPSFFCSDNRKSSGSPRQTEDPLSVHTHLYSQARTRTPKQIKKNIKKWSGRNSAINSLLFCTPPCARRSHTQTDIESSI